MQRDFPRTMVMPDIDYIVYSILMFALPEINWSLDFTALTVTLISCPKNALDTVYAHVMFINSLVSGNYTQ
jgi:hypothetical protein